MKFREGGVLAAETRELVGQQADVLRAQALFRGASAVNLVERQKNRHRPPGSIDPGKREHRFHHVIRVIPVGGALVPLADEAGITAVVKNFFPYAQIAGQAGCAVGSKAETEDEQQQAGSGPEDGAGGAGGQAMAAQRGIEARQATRLGEVGLAALRDTRQGIEIGGQPAFVFGEQLEHEIAGRARVGADEGLPSWLRRGAARDDYPAAADANLAAVEIEHGSKAEQPGQSRRLPQSQPGFVVQVRHSPIKPRQHGLIQQRLHNVGFPVSGRDCGPVGAGEQHGDLGNGVGILESVATAQGFLERRQRKAGIERQKSAVGVGGFQRRVLSAGLTQAVTNDRQQRLRRGTVGHANHAAGTGQGNELPGLLHIPLEQHQVLGRPAGGLLRTVVPVDYDIACQERQYFLGRNLLADGRHTQERTEWPRNGGGRRGSTRGFRCRKRRGCDGHAGHETREQGNA